MTNTLLEAIKAYSEIDFDDETLKSLAEAAVEKCEEETGKAFVESSALFCLAVKMLTLHWYDNRGTISTQTQGEIPFAIQPILNQIALSDTYEVKK